MGTLTVCDKCETVFNGKPKGWVFMGINIIKDISGRSIAANLLYCPKCFDGIEAMNKEMLPKLIKSF